MGIESEGLSEPRQPLSIEIVEARVDYQLREVYEVLEEEIAKITDETTQDTIRNLAMRSMRASYAKGLTDLREDPDIVKKIYHNIGSVDK